MSQLTNTLKGDPYLTLWVDETSGALDLSESTEKYSRACDHLDMNKFLDSNQPEFKKLEGVLIKMAEDGPKVIVLVLENSRRRTQTSS